MKIKPAILYVLLISLPVTNVLSVDIGDSAPNWRLQNGYGETVDFYRDSSDRVAVLIYWATWCPYCASLMPHIQEVANEFSNNPDVVFYAMNINENADPKRHMQEQGYTFDLILHADDTKDPYGVPGTPGVFVIDRNNRVVFRRVPDTPDVEVKNAVRAAITSALN